jgi:hypothetical protein
MTDLPCPSLPKPDDAYLGWDMLHSSPVGGGAEGALQKVMWPTGVQGELEEAAVPEEPHQSAAAAAHLCRQKEPSFSPETEKASNRRRLKAQESRVLLNR